MTQIEEGVVQPDILPHTLVNKTDKRVVMLSVDMANFAKLPDSLESSRAKYNKSQKTHVTILGNEAGKRVIEKIGDSAELNTKYDEWVESVDQLAITPLEEYYELHEKRDGKTRKRSVIQRVSIPGYDQKFQELRTILGFLDGEDLAYSPPHMTLYLPDGQEYGIGLETSEVLNSRDESIETGIIAFPVKIEGDKIVDLNS